MKFTASNAAEMGRKGALALIERNKRLAETVEVLAAIPPLADNSYAERRLARVRVQLERLSDMLDKEQDPRLIDRLTAAIDRLGKHEQFLSGRPGPGTLKPSSKPARSRRELAPQPLPAVDQPMPKHNPDEPNG